MPSYGDPITDGAKICRLGGVINIALGVGCFIASVSLGNGLFPAEVLSGLIKFGVILLVEAGLLFVLAVGILRENRVAALLAALIDTGTFVLILLDGVNGVSLTLTVLRVFVLAKLWSAYFEIQRLEEVDKVAEERRRRRAAGETPFGGPALPPPRRLVPLSEQPGDRTREPGSKSVSPSRRPVTPATSGQAPVEPAAPPRATPQTQSHHGLRQRGGSGRLSRPHSARQAQSSEGGIKEGLLTSLGVVVVMGLFAAGAFWLASRGPSAVGGASSARVETPKPDPTPAAPDEVAHSDQAPVNPEPVESEPEQEAWRPPTFTDEAAALAAIAGDRRGHRVAAAAAWLEGKMWREEGSRARFLTAVHDGGVDGELLQSVRQSFDLRAPKLGEAVTCFPLVEGSLRRQLLEQFVHEGRGNPEVVQVVSDAQNPDDPDPVLDETLIELGSPRPGATASLLASRGLDWARSEEGRRLLGEVARHAPAELTALAGHDQPAVRVLACELLGVKGEDTALGMLVARLEDEEPAVRQAAADALGVVGDSRATWRLARALHREQDAATQARLVESLQQLPHEGMMHQLGRLLTAKAEADRLAAIGSLQALRSTEAIPLLVRSLQDTVTVVRKAALRALSVAHRTPSLRPAIYGGANAIGKLAGDADRQIAGRARKLYHAITGRYP